MRGELRCWEVGASSTRFLPSPQAVDGPKLVSLTNKDDLKALGVTKVGHRTVLKKLIADLGSA